jgi:hypothetical protein
MNNIQISRNSTKWFGLVLLTEFQLIKAAYSLKCILISEVYTQVWYQY